jgi:plastocyanin
MQMAMSKRLLFITLAVAMAFLFASVMYASANLIRAGTNSNSFPAQYAGDQPIAGSMSDRDTGLCAGLSCGGTAPASTSATTTVQVRNNFFEPAVVTITVGDTVKWVRVEGLHNVKADDRSFTSGPPNSTWISYSHTFTRAGSFGYYCEVHGGPGGIGMAGMVVVEGTAVPLEPQAFVPLVIKP